MCLAVGRPASRPVRASSPARLIWSGSAVPTGPTGPSPRRYPRMTELTDRVPLAGPGVGLRGLQHQGEHQRRGARGTRRSRAGYSGQRRLTRTLPRMPGVSAGWCHAVLDSVSASSWGGDPPPGSSELTTHARPIRGEATRRGDRHGRAHAFATTRAPRCSPSTRLATSPTMPTPPISSSRSSAAATSTAPCS